MQLHRFHWALQYPWLCLKLNICHTKASKCLPHLHVCQSIDVLQLIHCSPHHTVVGHPHNYPISLLHRCRLQGCSDRTPYTDAHIH